jgi:hypothetical protein
MVRYMFLPSLGTDDFWFVPKREFTKMVFPQLTDEQCMSTKIEALFVNRGLCSHLQGCSMYRPFTTEDNHLQAIFLTERELSCEKCALSGVAAVTVQQLFKALQIVTKYEKEELAQLAGSYCDGRYAPWER